MYSRVWNGTRGNLAGHRLGVRLPKVCLYGSRVPRYNKYFPYLSHRHFESPEVLQLAQDGAENGAL